MINKIGLSQIVFAGLAGALAVLGFAPYGLYIVPVLSLGMLFYLCHSALPKQAALLGFSFGLGLYGFGIYWIYISLHDFGGMPWWFAGFCTGCLCAFMALFPALALYFSQRLGRFWLSAPVLWGLSDWVRSWIFTGFPWLTLGYSQVTTSPLAGFMPVFGVYGVSILVALIAALIVTGWKLPATHKQGKLNALMGIVLLLVVGYALRFITWTHPVGEPIRVALLQGNISQSVKWSPEAAGHTIAKYLDMVEHAQAQLIVLPETALPVIAQQLDATTVERLHAAGRKQGGDVLVGLVQYDAAAETYFNSAISFGRAPVQGYSKSHLVPFGEFIPLKAVFGWIYRDWLNMPLSDLSRGGHQPPMQLANQQVAVNICYEDVFGEEIIQPLPAATLLVNMSNDAWYGQSFAADQHMQFSQARALETGRMMLRATNTGATAIINQHGKVLAHAPHDTQTTLHGNAQGYRGSTPYIVWGNWPFILFSFAIIAFVLWRKTK